MTEAEGSSEPAGFKKAPRRAVASGWVGSALEYYDFFVYATAASLVFPDVFFPKGNPKLAIIESLATYGVGYAARPLGAFFLGSWGDQHGRKNVLVLCMLAMGCATFGVGLLPTYGAIGYFAPILLVTLRLIQGFAVGAELSGASAMIVENSPFGRRGYYASYTLQGTQGGQLIAAGVFLPLYFTLSTSAMDSWGWRIPFLLSSIVVIVGYVIRRNVDETPAFKQEAARGAVPRNPVYEAIRLSWPNMVRVICISLMNGVATLATTFGGTFATNSAYGVGMNTKPSGYGRSHPRALGGRQYHPRVGHPVRDRSLHGQGDLYDPPERLRRGMGAAGVCGGVRQGPARSRFTVIPLAGSVLEPARASRQSCPVAEGARHGIGTDPERA